MEESQDFEKYTLGLVKEKSFPQNDIFETLSNKSCVF